MQTVTYTGLQSFHYEPKKKVKSLEERKKQFLVDMKSELLSMDKKYDNRKFLNRFYSVWTEHGKNDRRMRFEKEKQRKSFDVRKRMQRFYSNFGEDQWKEEVEANFYDSRTKRKPGQMSGFIS